MSWPPKETDRATITDAATLLAEASNSRKDSLPATPQMSRNVSRVPSPLAQKYIVHTAPRRSSVSDTLTKDALQKKLAARLVYSTSFGGKMNFNLARDETTIGRKDDNHIVLSCVKISKYHALMKRVDG